MTDFEVRGADDFLRLSKALKHTGRTGMRADLNKGMRAAAAPLIAQSKQEALRRLPQRGGLAARVAATPQRVQVRTGQQTAGVRIVVGKTNSGARSTNEGKVRHPVFGDRDTFVEQSVPPGWFDDTMRAGAPVVRPRLEKAMEDIASKIVEEARHG